MLGGNPGWLCLFEDVDEAAWGLVVAWLCVDVSLSGNDLGAEGGTAIAGALPDLSSLTTLMYVHIEVDVWRVSYAMGTVCHAVCALSGKCVVCGVWCDDGEGDWV